LDFIKGSSTAKAVIHVLFFEKPVDPTFYTFHSSTSEDGKVGGVGLV
jgi:hypothetical protein